MKLTEQEISELVGLRKNLHAHPEISGSEKETAKSITKYLETCKPSGIHSSIGGHGVVAVYNSNHPGPTILFRADTDALPIEEENKFDHRSQNPGISHKCGHDGHTAILLGLAKFFSKNPPEKGIIYLIFQPAEEIGTGAAAVLDDPFFKDLRIDRVYGLHNLPGFPMNQIVLKEDEITAAVTGIVIELNGRTSHAAEPEFGINPALAVAEIINKMHSWSNNQTHSVDFRVITPVQVQMGTNAFGVSAGAARLSFTIRTWTEVKLQEILEKVERFLEELSLQHKLKLNIYYTEKFKANKNDPEAISLIRNAAQKLGLKVHELNQPFKWGEDFGYFTQRYKGAFFGIGAGETSPALHNPDYDFPDSLIETGASVFYELYRESIKDLS